MRITRLEGIVEDAFIALDELGKMKPNMSKVWKALERILEEAQDELSFELEEDDKYAKWLDEMQARVLEA